jgi:hypothetical protein
MCQQCNLVRFQMRQQSVMVAVSWTQTMMIQTRNSLGLLASITDIWLANICFFLDFSMIHIVDHQFEQCFAPDQASVILSISSS